jgi:hypothetical protein
MKLTIMCLAASAALFGITETARAAIFVDGALDAAYGSPSATVAYNPAAPNGNFAAPTNEAADVGYSIYTASDANYWYGFFQADPAGGGAKVATFANLYFDLDPANGNGSDLGFELSPTTQDVFIPGISGSNTLTSDILTASSPDGDSFEVGIPISYFTTPFGSLPYYSGQQFVSADSPDLVLRLSQTFGYSVAGGSSYGPDRLGLQALQVSVPEPVTLSIFGVGLVGAAALRRRKKVKA